MRTRSINTRVITSRGTKLDVRYRVAEAGDLVTSNNDDFSVNENYPQELQNRNRKSYANKDQVEDIAEKLGVSRQAVAKWERGESVPDVASCLALADIYGTSLDMLVRNMHNEAKSGEDGKHVFGVSKMNDKGQITLPAECRRVFGLKPGDSILILGDEDKGIALVNLGNVGGDNN